MESSRAADSELGLLEMHPQNTGQPPRTLAMCSFPEARCGTGRGAVRKCRSHWRVLSEGETRRGPHA